MQEPSRPSFEFGPFLLDSGKRLLLRSGEPVPLAPKVLDTLLALIQHRADVISKDDLLRLVWGDTVVEEGGLARNISLLRKTLGEKPDDHRYIVTVPARGYRFVADVREPVAPAPPPPEPVPATIPPAASGTMFVRRRHSAWQVAGIAGLVLLAGATALVWLTASSSVFHSSPLTNHRLIRVTSTAGLNTDPALSSDGQLIAYASDRAGTDNLDIWVQPVHGDTPTRITSAEGDEVEPSFSPDGSLIAFSGGEIGGIYVVGALGGQPRLIVQGARTRRPRFSPDGRFLLYWVGQTAWVIMPGNSVPGATGTLAVVPANGGTPRALAGEFASARYGVWSPDGKKILFVGERGGDPEASLDWYVIDADGSRVVRTEGPRSAAIGAGQGDAHPGRMDGTGRDLHDNRRNGVERVAAAVVPRERPGHRHAECPDIRDGDRAGRGGDCRQRDGVHRVE